MPQQESPERQIIAHREDWDLLLVPIIVGVANVLAEQERARVQSVQGAGSSLTDAGSLTSPNAKPEIKQ